MTIMKPTIVRGDDWFRWLPEFYYNKSNPTYTYYSGGVHTIVCKNIEHSVGFIWGMWGFWPIRWSVPNKEYKAMKSLTDFYEKVLAYHLAHVNERWGQQLMNTLREYDSELFDKITGTDADCFYDNSKANEFIATLQEEWK